MPEKPQGQITRGKTAPNRLRRVDAFVAAYDPGLISANNPAFYVDLGYGSRPTTTLESAARLRQLNPNLAVLGVEIEPERVARGKAFADDQTHFRLGGFNLPLRSEETVRFVRAFNVFRQYEEIEVRAAYDQLLAQIEPGGVLMDGTSDPYGRIWTANMVRRAATKDSNWDLEALVLGWNPRGDLDPDSFQTRLPKSFIHRMVSGEKIFTFMEDWKAAARDTKSASTWGPRAWFVAAGKDLAGRGHDIARADLWLKRGWLVWRNTGLQIK